MAPRGSAATAVMREVPELVSVTEASVKSIKEASAVQLNAGRVPDSEFESVEPGDAEHQSNQLRILPVANKFMKF